MTDDIFAGTWHSTYWYPSNNHDGDDTSEYDVEIQQTGNELVIHSLPNPIHAYIQMRLVVDNELVTGSWLENTSPEGEFQAMMYSGVLQLIVDDDKQRMSGKWVGVGRDLENQRPEIYTGKWELTRTTPQPS